MARLDARRLCLLASMQRPQSLPYVEFIFVKVKLIRQAINPCVSNAATVVESEEPYTKPPRHDAFIKAPRLELILRCVDCDTSIASIAL